MTNEQIDKMEAGPEMDALVEKEVMGRVPCDAWVDENLGSAGGPVKVLGSFHRGTQADLEECVRTGKMLEDIIGPPCPHGKGGCYPVGCPAPRSTKIWAAWEVLEKIGGSFQIERYHSGTTQEEDGVYGYAINLHYRVAHRSFAKASTAPLAICCAGLKAANNTSD